MTIAVAKYYKLLEDVLSGQALENFKASDFNTIESIIEADIADLQNIKGIGFNSAKELKKWANNILKEEAISVIPEDIPVVKIVEEEEPEKFEDIEEDDEIKWILQEIHVDSYTTLRKRVRLTPAVCPDCALDLLKNSKLPPWEKLTSLDKLKVKEAMKRHKEVQHSSLSDKKILSDVEMKTRTSWTPTDTMRP